MACHGISPPEIIEKCLRFFIGFNVKFGVTIYIIYCCGPHGGYLPTEPVLLNIFVKYGGGDNFHRFMLG